MNFAPIMQLAIKEARRFIGATSPNPPVGAVGLSREGQVLSIHAHQKAGTSHAEAKVIEDCRERGLLGRLDTLIVTLEPCNHQGRTGPCSEAILAAGIRRVAYGASDPNPTAQGGARKLAVAGLEVVKIESPECEELITPFSHWIRTGLPWVTVKTARDEAGSMIPPPGQKTFTSPESLRLAHELRRRADAILTGSGTVLADNPLFTVRHVPDHPGAQRWLALLDRRGRVSPGWLESAESRGFRVVRPSGIEEALRFLGKNGALEVLVEAGPTLSEAVLSSGFWSRHVVITRGNPDRIECRENPEEIYVHRDH